MAKRGANSPWRNDYTRRTSQQQAKAGVEARETKAETLARDLERLAESRANRPLRPPGRK